jgi:peptidoglycan/xylan/chitin deacetylase (PgdA/CDA1 family)
MTAADEGGGEVREDGEDPGRRPPGRRRDVSDAHLVTVATQGSPSTGIDERGAEPGVAPRPPPSTAVSYTRSAVRRGATALLARRSPGAAAAGLAAARGRGLALVYHRVRPDPAQGYEVVPCVPVEQFRVHVETLRGVGDIVPLDQLREPERSRRERGRPRFALTFDDDYATHLRHVLPILRELRVPATFFLSGRSLHDLGPYWWEVLEARIRAEGPERVGGRLDVGSVDPAEIAAACVEDPARQRRLEADAGEATDQLRPDEIAELAAAGMTIGFHTVAHPVLPLLDRAARREALTLGRDELRELTGQPLASLAYPHGRADAATAADARTAGYDASWTGADSPVSPRSDRWRLGRWEAGPVEPTTLRVRALARLLRPVRADG